MPNPCSLPPLSLCAPQLHQQLQTYLAAFEHEMSSKQSLGGAASPIYDILKIAIPYVIKHQYALDDEQVEFFGWACSGAEHINQDVYDRNQWLGHPPYELARTFIDPLMLFLGLFSDIADDAALSGLLPSIRSVLVTQAGCYLEADPDINPEILLPHAEALYDHIETLTPDGIGKFLRQFRDVLCDISPQPFDLLAPVNDPLQRFTDDEINEIQSTMVIGHGRPPVPRFGDGPRLQRLEQRIEAIQRGYDDDKHLLPVLEKVRSELQGRRDYLANLDADARNGAEGRKSSERHLH